MPPPVLHSNVRTNKQTTLEMADIASLIQLILNRDERRQQDELQACREEADRRQEEADRRQHEMAALIAAVSQPVVNQTPQNVVTSQTNVLPSSQTNVVPPPTPNAKMRPTITPPQPLQPDVSYKRFRDWRRRFHDYAVMTDLSTLPLGKQHIQLRTCLTPEMLHTLHYRLQVPKDDSTPIADFLATLDRHFKAQMNEALRRRQFDKYCRLTKKAGEESFKGGRWQSAGHVTQDSKGSGARRVQAATRTPSETSPPIVVSVTYEKETYTLDMLPDTGADTIIIGPDHLQHIGLSLSDLQPPPQTQTYTADSSLMKSAIGSVQVQLQVKEHSTQEWMDVPQAIPIPLLSYRACRELALIPERFSHLIAQVTHARVQKGKGSSAAVSTIQQTQDPLVGAAHPNSTTLDKLPSPAKPSPTWSNTTTPSQAREYFLKEYADVLVTKQDLNPVSKRWYRTGEVVVQPRPRLYDVRLPNGRILRHNRIHLRPVSAINEDPVINSAADSSAPHDPPAPRRSARLCQRQRTTN
ncbi:hypothetical protein Pcinc_019092 [Petrolisthes cinctipes]|uniref:Peptidase A2 domain-containing protein n=1 Tax=Petrolisthes cinctipes TaxID=88211 RepID=A0AAE1FMD5_PETCI|nr:hypothetical protein Pcinc_019092 [Petrolisthes cinctipes]